MSHAALTAISSIDGRYCSQTAALKPYFSEFALIRHRLLVEIRWLEQLAAHPQITEAPPLDESAQAFLKQILDEFDEAQAELVKGHEAATRHDVKALEYYLKEKLEGHPALAGLKEFVHFACTTWDINNLAYGLMLSGSRERALTPMLEKLIAAIRASAHDYAEVAMLSRTHGQPASPTTMGKELANFAARLESQFERFKGVSILGKINGAVGNYNAHLAAYPELDWEAVAEDFVRKLGLRWNPRTTQIEPYDYMAELFHALCRLNTILIDLNRDLWGYVSLGYFRQRAAKGEVGSSTMPHKVNPIDFENSEGNLGIANALLGHLAEKLPISRWQRDLSDSTALRTVGAGLAHGLIAYQSCLQGLARLAINEAKMLADLDDNWEILAEALQTVMRRHGVDQPYEKLKALTRGERVTQRELHDFIDSQPLPAAVKRRLKELRPSAYLGNAAQQAKSA